MDKQQAKHLIRDTFEGSFDKDVFTRFIKNLLNKIDIAPFTYQGNYIPDAYKQCIKTLERIGKFSDGENCIDILIITLQKETSLERARTMQRNFVSWYLNGSRGGEMKDAALAAFVSPDEEDWRFSLVKMDYKFEKTQTGKIKVKEEFTPARRWSFLVGANEKSHTAQSRLVNILANDEHAPILKEIENAFDIETVTKEFFLKYRDLFLRTKEELDRVVKKDPKVETDFEAKGVDTVNFAKKLLGQIVFLYFLQKKGWFGAGRDAAWGYGSKHFLRELFKKTHGGYNNFFNDILEPLFYEALRIDRSHDDDYYSRFNCKIPFLNGGLFDPIGNYNWVHTDIYLPDKLFSNQNKTKEGDTGDGILDIFDRYNFTVKEDEPLEKEVAIDPELLGKTYEKFNAIRPDNYAEFKAALKSGKTGEENKFNKKFGVYYTPREIVHYMCQQSLINYLATELVWADCNPPVSKEDIETLIHSGEHVSENEARVLRKGKETETYFYQLPESIRNNAKLIDDKLADITVCDPAVGSGAFPVGMMSEIVKARNVLSTFIQDKKRTPYEFKRRCIEHSLYGVDIDPGAVEIAKLRLWLSLVVDEDDIKNIKPLPNLDYKVVCGNSLLGVEKDLFNEQLFTELERLKPLHFNETNPTKKQEYKKQIDDLISQITKGHKEFDFEVYFSEVFHEKKGFDVVIANPPYLKERDNKSVFEIINNSDFGKKYHQGKMDYWYYFLHKAIDVLNKEGVISYITSRYWLNSTGAKKLIQRVRSELSFVEFVDIGKLKVFDEVAGQHMVAVYQKTREKIDFIYKKLENNLSDITKNEDTENIKISVLSNKKIFAENDEIILEQNNFSVLNTIKMGDIADISQGVVEAPDKLSTKQIKKSNKSGYDIGQGVFVLTKQEISNLNLSRNEMFVLKKYLDPHNVDKYVVQFEDRYLIYSDKLTKEKIRKDQNYSNLKKHLDKFKIFITSSNNPYGLHRPREQKYFENPKIIFKNMFVNVGFSYDDKDNYYFGFSFSSVIQEDKNYNLKYILAILNSKFAENWFYKNGKKRGAGVDIGVEKLRTFPIKEVSHPEQKPFIDLVDKILTITKDDDYLQNSNKQAKVKDLEAEIDQLVYKLYGLSPEEIKIVEGLDKN
ncbi:MAG: TaqI-like C-terminal specificity domain-containing protein [Bacteroidales bacterium]|nr:TaqI-like C-terminal specificity domain-containing protein [Bacteroidales bacterium]